MLKKINRLYLIQKLFGQITITKIIADEFGNELPDYITIEDPVNNTYQKILESFLDKGEASAMALALEKKECLLIIDDNKGRKEAKQLGLNFTGTLGVLITAKEKGLIGSISEIIQEIQNTNFRLSTDLINATKKRCGE